jgi:hypothetical protein
MPIVGMVRSSSPVVASMCLMSPRSRIGRVHPAAGQMWSSQAWYPA